MKLAAVTLVCLLALALPAPSRAADAPAVPPGPCAHACEPPRPQSQLELGVTTALSVDWLSGGVSTAETSPSAALSDGFPNLLAGFSLGYRYEPVTIGAELGFGRQLQNGTLGSVNGGGFFSLDLSQRLRLRFRLFEQSISLETEGPVGLGGRYSSQFTGVGGGVELAGVVPIAETSALQGYLGFEGTNLSRESDASGSAPADARLLRLIVGLRLTFDTRLGYTN